MWFSDWQTYNPFIFSKYQYDFNTGIAIINNSIELIVEIYNLVIAYLYTFLKRSFLYYSWNISEVESIVLVVSELI